MRKILLILLCLLMGCSNSGLDDKKVEVKEENLPSKLVVESASMNDSSINSKNIDEYLFREDSVYIDTREVNQFNEEGHIGGFVNIPFYEVIASLRKDSNTLFIMDKAKDSEGLKIGNIGDINSYLSNYEESEMIMKQLFPKDKNILIISTAGVESHYLINLLIQLGYDPAKLYNVGCFSNNAGNHIAYRNRKDAKYFVEGHNLFTYDYQVNFDDLKKYDSDKIN